MKFGFIIIIYKYLLPRYDIIIIKFKIPTTLRPLLNEILRKHILRCYKYYFHRESFVILGNTYQPSFKYDSRNGSRICVLTKKKVILKRKNLRNSFVIVVRFYTLKLYSIESDFFCAFDSKSSCSANSLDISSSLRALLKNFLFLRERLMALFRRTKRDVLSEALAFSDSSVSFCIREDTNFA